LFNQFAGGFSLERPQQVSFQAVSNFLLQHDNKLFFYVSELLFTGKGQSQANKLNNLADQMSALLLPS